MDLLCFHTLENLIIVAIVQSSFEQFEWNNRSDKDEEKIYEQDSHKIGWYFCDAFQNDIHFLVPRFKNRNYFDYNEPFNHESIQFVNKCEVRDD